MKMVFMGTPDFAVTCLDAVIAAGHEVAAVITQPDRPKGRGNKLAAPPVKERAQALGLSVYQPESVKDDGFLSMLAAFEPQVIVVVAYGRILPQTVLKLPPYGCINVHGSLLPRYRGAAPIQWAVLNGEPEAGVTIMQMDAGMDTGDMLLKGALPVQEDDTTGSLFEKLAQLGGALLVEALTGLEAGILQPEPQDEAMATYAPMLTKADEQLDWQKPAKVLHNQIRGLSPAPGAYTWWQQERLKIWRSRAEKDTDGAAVPGAVIEIAEDSFVIQTVSGALRVYEVQPAGKKAMPAKAFLNGAGLELGSVLGVQHE